MPSRLRRRPLTEERVALTNRLVRYFTPLPLLSFPALAAHQAVLANGDTINGAIVKKDSGNLTIKSEFLGEVTMPWSAVKSIRSGAELSVVLPSGETVKGKIASAGGPLQIAAGPATTAAPLAGVAAVRDAAEQQRFERMLHPGIPELWNGNFDRPLPGARQRPHRRTHHRLYRRPQHAQR